MDPFLREELERLYQEDDRLRLEFEQHERQWAKRTQLQTASGGQELVYKTHVPQPTQQPQQRIPDLDDAVMARWDAWLYRALEANNEDIDKALEEILTHIYEHLDAVREEIASLRADMNVQTGIARGEIKELKRDVA